MKTILACFDFSGVTSTQLEFAAAMGAAFGAKLYLLHVVSHTATGTGSEMVRMVEPYPPALMREARERLEGLQESIRSHGLDVSTILVESRGDLSKVILEEADRLDADLIVMGSHGLGMMYHILVGSTAEGVFKRAKCPVLFVPVRAPAKVSGV
jgi:nucleotide-binding universal stress UspA family protein